MGAEEGSVALENEIIGKVTKRTSDRINVDRQAIGAVSVMSMSIVYR